MGQGGESTVYKIEPFVPLEVVAKITNKNTTSKEIFIEN